MKTSTSNKCWRRCGGKRALVPCWWECKLVQLLQKTGWRSLKTKQNKFPCDPIPLLPHTRREWSHRKTRAPYVHTALLTTARHGDPFKPTDRRVDKEDVVHLHNGLWLSHKKEQNWVISRADGSCFGRALGEDISLPLRQAMWEAAPFLPSIHTLVRRWLPLGRLMSLLCGLCPAIVIPRRGNEG